MSTSSSKSPYQSLCDEELLERIRRQTERFKALSAPGHIVNVQVESSSLRAQRLMDEFCRKVAGLSSRVGYTAAADAEARFAEWKREFLAALEECEQGVYAELRR